nr:reverse transcriptase domain-containing protein [Tanacetum cinerariifolium]
AYEGPSIPTESPLEKVDEQNAEEILDQKHSNSSGSTAQVQPQIVPILIAEPDVPRTQSITCPKGVAEDVFVKVGKFHFLTDFVMVDFEANLRVPLILGRSFLRTARALIDVYGKEITLRVNDESITFNLNQTMRYSSTYDDTSMNRVDVIDVTCDDFVQDVLDFQYNPKSSNPTLVSNDLNSENESCKVLIVKSSSLTLTPFGESDFYLDEIEEFLNDDSILTGIENPVYDADRDILGWRVCIDYRKLNDATRKDHFPLPFMDQMLEREGIVLGHKISKSRIEVDRAKVDVIAKLPHPTTVKGFRSFLGHAGFYRRFIQDFSKIARPMTHLLEKKTPFIFSKECINVFNTLKKKLLEALILVVPDWNLPFELMCDASDYAIGAVLGQRKSKHFQPIHYASKTMTEAQIHYTTTKKEMLTVVYAFEKFWPYLILSKSIVYTDHSALKYLLNKQDAKPRKLLRSSKLATRDLPEAIMVPISQRGKDEIPQNKIQVCEIFDIWGIDFMGPFSSSKGNKYILVAVDYLSKWVEAKALPTNDARVVVKFLKSLFSRFGIPRAIISDCGTHFYNDQFTHVMIKYGVTHRLAAAYHPQTSGQVEVSNHGLKRILERTVEENRTSWSDKLDDALWAFRTTYKTLIGFTPYKLVYGKSCHLPIELDHRAYWALKHVNFDLKTVGDHRKLQFNELSELRDQAYENSVIYKERTKKLHDFKIKNRIFNVGDQVLLFNSCLKIFSGKLKTRWSGPFTITCVFPYGTIELSQPNGPNFKVNGHRVKHYFGGDIPSNVTPDLHTLPKDN